ncbi:MAG: M6 family metalloprotease domain-containing protein, partial [Planctomycetota bacterium]
MIKRFFSLCVVITFLLLVPARGSYLRNVPQTLTQPDGSKIDCFASGDEFYHRLHDKDGFTIVIDASGYWVYAVEANGELVASSHVLGTGKPRDVSLQPGLRISKEEYLRRRAAFFAGIEPTGAPLTGTINNLCIFIRFSGDTEFPDPRSDYDDMFNSTAAADNSMRNYYDEVTYRTLAINTTHYPTCALNTNLSYQDTRARNFYQPYHPTANPNGYRNDNEKRQREHTLLRDAVNDIASQVPAGLDIDGDNDGNVDNVCFIIRGGTDGWSDLLWAHWWQLSTHNVQINGIKVWDYNFQLEFTVGVGVLCHEMFHTLGAPDLYHYVDNGIAPVDDWGLMENESNPPEHMGAYMKHRYGTWISALPLITNAGRYTLMPLTSSTDNAKRFNSPQSSNEYYVIEYRRQAGTFENSVPGFGLLIYRINTARDGQGNANGPPDEVYIYRPGGTTTTNGNPRQAHFSADVGRTCINDSTNP